MTGESNQTKKRCSVSNVDIAKINKFMELVTLIYILIVNLLLIEAALWQPADTVAVT
jgi:hypothetical protein